MNKEAAKEQFNKLTEELGIEHTFSFDEAWEFVKYKKTLQKVRTPDFKLLPDYTTEQFREGIVKFEEKFKNSEIARSKDELNEFNPVRHFFADGLYLREVFNPAGEVIVTKIHKVEHPFFLMKGTMSILTEDGEQRISAPFYSITKPGTKRIIYAHTDCILITVHATDKTDIDEIEKDVIAKDYKELK